MTPAHATELAFPVSWRCESCERYQRLADMRKVTQADVDEIEARLVWFREWRNYYATTAGQDEIIELGRAG